MKFFSIALRFSAKNFESKFAARDTSTRPDYFKYRFSGKRNLVGENYIPPLRFIFSRRIVPRAIRLARNINKAKLNHFRSPPSSHFSFKRVHYHTNFPYTRISVNLFKQQRKT